MSVKRRVSGSAVLAVALAVAASAAAAGEPIVSWIDSRQGLPQARITALLAVEGRLYAGLSGKGIAVFEGIAGPPRFVTRADGLPSDEVVSLVHYRGKVHAGTAEGIAVEEGKRWTTLREAAGVPLRNVVLGASPDGKELWACSMFLAGGTLVYDGKGWTFVGGEGKGLFNNITAFGFLPDGVLLGAVSGMVYERKGKEKQIEPLRERFPDANVTSVAARGGSVYAGTNRGLYVWRGTEWQPALLPGEFSGGAVFSILKSDIDLFVGGVRGLLLLDRTGKTRVLSGTPAFPAGPVYHLVEEGGTIYAATDLGVAVLRGWRE